MHPLWIHRTVGMVPCLASAVVMATLIGFGITAAIEAIANWQAMTPEQIALGRP